MTTSKLKCAIYTRKSSDEGLEQDFNSLDAQREACEAYITSQAGLGWKALPKHYDDGGLSGGHMDRPALQTLLDDIKAGRINVVAVYKIDRLTRSLMDFARMVDIFDAHKVSFVSVTQQFNTTTSMGRLTLNVLLSFAQFEREVTAERIRDKIAASRKKGIWMGGLVPLGYDVDNKQMVVNKVEAKTVSQIFNLYQELKNVRLLKKRCDELGIITKIRRQRDGPETGGRPFTRGHLYRVLKNPVYIGKVRHKDQIHDGQHAAIIDDEQWSAVQVLLADSTINRGCAKNVKSLSLLKGLIFDEAGDRLSPSHAVKNGRRYRYYISFRLQKDKRQATDGWRLPATQLEQAIISALQRWLLDEVAVVSALDITGQNIAVIKSIGCSSRKLAAQLGDDDPVARAETLNALINRITVREDRLAMSLDPSSLRAAMQLQSPVSQNASPCGDGIIFSVPITFKRRGVEAKIILGDQSRHSPESDEKLIRLVAMAHAWFEKLKTGKANSIPEIAEAEGITPNDVSRVLQLAFLKPTIVESILAGTQSVELTARRLKRVGELPVDWQDQEVRLGFAAT